MSNSDVKKSQLEDQLLGSQNFDISLDELVEIFVPENMQKAPGPDSLSRSLTLLSQYNYAPEIVAKLRSSATAGIEGSPEDLRKRVQTFGANKRHQRKIRTICDMICEVFQDFILRVLCVAAVVSTTLGIIQNGWAHGFQEGAGICIAIIIIVMVSVGNDYSKEKQFQALMSKSDVSETRVRRGDVWSMRDSEELVVGDLVMINQGETIPADCIVLEGNNCSCSEAALTGEPDELNKEPVNAENVGTHPDPFLLQSALCQGGSAKALVCAVGDNTTQGRAGLSMNIESEQTPLQKKLDSIANGIGKLGMYVAILTFIAIVVVTMIKTFKEDDRNFDMAFVSDVCNGLVIAITVVVVAVPEGLPLAVTISLAYSVGKMFEENNLVRKLHSSETMGNANEICTDKTGTLTLNQMTVQSIYVEDTVIDGDANTAFMEMASADEVMRGVIFNSTAFIQTNDDGTEETTGNVTEVGLIKYLTASNCPTKDKITERDNGEPIFTIPFSSARKRATTAMWIDNGSKVRVFCKGAPEIVIEKCDQFHSKGGEVEELEEDKKTYCVETIVRGYAEKCLRTLLIAYVDFDKSEWESLAAQNNDFATAEDQEVVECGLIMAGIFGLKDPLRKKVREAVEVCHKAGINVRMVTGDNIDTARAISLEAGIIDNEDLEDPTDVCMTGKEFRERIGGCVRIVDEMVEVSDDEHPGQKKQKKKQKVEAIIENMAEFRKIEKKLKVMARSQPDDKFMLVDGLIRVGRTVAVTGDGTNDAPALNRSDVGFAMGKTGTDVAKHACDIQLMDDNFCSILTAVRFGRNIYDNVRKFLQFQLTVNVVAMFIVFAGACLFAEPPLTSTQMLWVNLIMDTFAALALATEPPHLSVLNRKPATKADLIVNSVMWRNIAGQAIYQIIVLLVLLFVGGDLFGIDYQQSDPFYPTAEQVLANPTRGWVEQEATQKVLMYTIIFQTFVFMQLFNQINSRKLGEREFNIFSSFCNNPMFIIILIATFAIQMVIVQYGDRYMRALPLTWEQNAYCAAIGAFCIIWGLVLKCIPARWFEWIKLEEREMSAEEEQTSMVASMRKSHTQRMTGSKRSSTRAGKQVHFKDEDNYKIN